MVWYLCCMEFSVLTIVILVVLALCIVFFALRVFSGLVQVFVPLIFLVLLVGVGMNIFHGDPLWSPSGLAVWDVRDTVAPVVAALNSTASNISDTVGKFGVVEVATDSKK